MPEQQLAMFAAWQGQVKLISALDAGYICWASVFKLIFLAKKKTKRRECFATISQLQIAKIVNLRQLEKQRF